MHPMRVADSHDDTDAMFDTSPHAMAGRLGDRARELMRQGRAPRQVAKLAASYAFIDRPALRAAHYPPAPEDARPSFTDNLFALARSLAETFREGPVC